MCVHVGRCSLTYFHSQSLPVPDYTVPTTHTHSLSITTLSLFLSYLARLFSTLALPFSFAQCDVTNRCGALPTGGLPLDPRSAGGRAQPDIPGLDQRSVEVCDKSNPGSGALSGYMCPAKCLSG